MITYSWLFSRRVLFKTIFLHFLFSSVASFSADKVLEPAATPNSDAVTLIMVPPDWSFHGRLDVAGLKRSGCHFVTNDPRQIAAMSAILDAYPLQLTQGQQADFDIRTGIFFTSEQGELRSLMLGAGFVNQDYLKAWSAQGQNPGRAMWADKALLPQLKAWARALPVNHSLSLSDGCVKFLQGE